MKNKMIWGLAALAILICTAFVFLTIRNYTDNQKLKQELAELEQEQHQPQQPEAENKPPREAQDGFEWEWHGDHWHEMPVATPIAQNEVPQAVPPLVEPIPNKTVEELRQYLEERGHWSAAWIPPFPPDDEEAARMAHNTLILLKHHEEVGDVEFYTGAALIANQEVQEVLDYYTADTPRSYELRKLRWGFLYDTPKLYPELSNYWGSDIEELNKVRRKYGHPEITWEDRFSTEIKEWDR